MNDSFSDFLVAKTHANFAVPFGSEPHTSIQSNVFLVSPFNMYRKYVMNLDFLLVFERSFQDEQEPKYMVVTR